MKLERISSVKKTERQRLLFQSWTELEEVVQGKDLRQRPSPWLLGGKNWEAILSFKDKKGRIGLGGGGVCLSISIWISNGVGVVACRVSVLEPRT